MQSIDIQGVRPNRAIDSGHRNESDEFICPICLDSFDGDVTGMCGSFNCGHRVCSGCLTDFLTYRIVRENDAFPTCHLAFCDSVASNRLLQAYVGPDVLRLASKRQDERAARSADGRPMFCQNSACPDAGKQPLPAPALSNVGEAAYLARCPECEQEACLRCGSSAHYGEQCKRILSQPRGNGNINSLFRIGIGGDHSYSFWGHFAFCSRCLSISHVVNETDIISCCGEEVVVLREQGDFYRYCRKLAWRLLLYTLCSDFMVRFAVIHALNLWIAFWVVTWRRPFLFLFSILFCPLVITKLYYLIRGIVTISCNHYIRLFCAADAVSSSDSLGSLEIDL